MGSDGSQFESLPGLLLAPLLVLAFACSVLGSFVIWRLRLTLAAGREHVPFHLHVLHDEEGNRVHAWAACALGLVALLLPLSLILRLGG